MLLEGNGGVDGASSSLLPTLLEPLLLGTVFKKHKQHRHGFKLLILPSQCVADLSLGHKLKKKSRVISQTKYMYIYM